MFAEHTLVQLGGYNTNIIQYESSLQVFSEIHSPSADVLLLKFSFLIHRRKVQGWHKCFIKKYRKERYRSDMSASIAVLVLHITLDRFTQRECTSGPSVFLYFCICVFLYFCFFVFLYFCIFVFVYLCIQATAGEKVSWSPSLPSLFVLCDATDRR